MLHPLVTIELLRCPLASSTCFRRPDRSRKVAKSSWTWLHSFIPRTSLHRNLNPPAGWTHALRITSTSSFLMRSVAITASPESGIRHEFLQHVGHVVKLVLDLVQGTLDAI